MNKLKSVVKRLLGRGNGSRSPVTIDICAETVEGFVVIGWYLTDVVKELELVDETSSPVQFQLSDVERADVVANIGKPAIGFQLTFKTEKPLSSVQLLAVLSDGAKTRVPLSLNGTEAIVASGANPESIAKIASSSGIKASCEFLLVSSTHYFVSGWIVDKDATINVEVQSRAGKKVASLDGQLRYNRKDVQDILGSHTKLATGFMASFSRLDNKDYAKKELKLNFTVGGRTQSVDVQDLIYADADPMLNAKRLLNFWTPHNYTHLRAHGLFRPMLEELYPSNKTCQSRRHDINGQVVNPRLSIIIPLYARYDFLRYQMAHFNRHKEYQDVEIIYVVDDPKIASSTKALANRLGQLYDTPFSVVLLSENVGFGLANNIGVSHARSDTLVLLNSDVLPKNPRWMDQMYAVVNQENAGIVGARLLFEDETIQHDGMAPMVLREYPGLLFNDHPKKGWPKEMVNYEHEVERKDMLTAACWMLKKELFESVGGFDPAYILGDFEDSDVCLKVLGAGKHNFIHHGTELYHLERQSQNLVDSGNWKHNLTILNAITFNERWNEKLQEMVGATK